MSSCCSVLECYILLSGVKLNTKSSAVIYSMEGDNLEACVIDPLGL